MADTYYSEHFQPLQADAVKAATTGHMAAGFVDNSPFKIATFKNITFANTGDAFKCFRLKSSDIPLALDIVNASDHF